MGTLLSTNGPARGLHVHSGPATPTLDNLWSQVYSGPIAGASETPSSQWLNLDV
jgi:hypothetical protein